MLLPGEGVKCTEKSAVRRLKPEDRPPVPYSVDIETVCKNRKLNSRVLDGYTINNIILKMIMENLTIDPSGIRIIGGIYCETLNLVGVNIPYSLILDWSIIKGNLEALTFHVKGDFSLDQGVFYGNVRIVRAEIAGIIMGTAFFLSLYAGRRYKHQRRNKNK